MKKTPKQYYEELTNFDNTIDYMDGLFSLLVNNEITPEELVDIMYQDLSNGNKYFKYLTNQNFFDWKEEFLSYDIKDQKEYFSHSQTVVVAAEDGYDAYYSEAFNNRYFYYLVERARKSDNYTKKLLEYLNEISPIDYDINLKFHYMKWLKYLNFEKFAGVNWEYNSLVQKFYRLTGRFYTSLYDLVTHVCLQKYGIEDETIFKYGTIEQLFNNLCHELYKEEILGIDLEDVFGKFFLLVESLLNYKPLVVNKNVANSLRIGFCIIDKKYYREGDYNLDKTHIYIKRVRDKVLKNKQLVQAVNKYYKDNKEELEKQPNGYTVLYNTLFNLSDEEFAAMEEENNEI